MILARHNRRLVCNSHAIKPENALAGRSMRPSLHLFQQSSSSRRMAGSVFDSIGIEHRARDTSQSFLVFIVVVANVSQNEPGIIASVDRSVVFAIHVKVEEPLFLLRLSSAVDPLIYVNR